MHTTDDALRNLTALARELYGKPATKGRVITRFGLRPVIGTSIATPRRPA